MKEVIIRDLNNKIISDKNLYENPEEFLEVNKKHNTWGRNERWVRAKQLMENGDPNEPEHWVWYEEHYNDEDVIGTETRNENTGDLDENGEFIFEDVLYVLLRADYIIEIKDYKRVPTEVTRRQARRALLQAGLLDDIEAYMQTTAPRETKIDWEDSQVFRRDWESLPVIASALGLTDDQIDDLFILAETL